MHDHKQPLVWHHKFICCVVVYQCAGFYCSSVSVLCVCNVSSLQIHNSHITRVWNSHLPEKETSVILSNECVLVLCGLPSSTGQDKTKNMYKILTIDYFNKDITKIRHFSYQVIVFRVSRHNILLLIWLLFHLIIFCLYLFSSHLNFFYICNSFLFSYFHLIYFVMSCICHVSLSLCLLCEMCFLK